MRVWLWHRERHSETKARTRRDTFPRAVAPKLRRTCGSNKAVSPNTWCGCSHGTTCIVQVGGDTRVRKRNKSIRTPNVAQLSPDDTDTSPSATMNMCFAMAPCKKTIHSVNRSVDTQHASGAVKGEAHLRTAQHTTYPAHRPCVPEQIFAGHLQP